MKHEHSILLVDDDSASAQTMRVILEGAGRQITTVSDGHEALNLLSTERFDLAIFELTLPGLSGAKLMEEMKRRQICVPVIYVTAHGEWESYLTLMNMGAFEYLTKPVNKREILLAVRNSLEKGGKYSGA